MAVYRVNKNRGYTEQKRKAIELATSCESPSRKNPSAKSYTVSDEDTLRKLYGLK